MAAADGAFAGRAGRLGLLPPPPAAVPGIAAALLLLLEEACEAAPGPVLLLLPPCLAAGAALLLLPLLLAAGCVAGGDFVTGLEGRMGPLVGAVSGAVAGAVVVAGAPPPVGLGLSRSMPGPRRGPGGLRTPPQAHSIRLLTVQWCSTALTEQLQLELRLGFVK